MRLILFTILVTLAFSGVISENVGNLEKKAEGVDSSASVWVNDDADPMSRVRRYPDLGGAAMAQPRSLSAPDAPMPLEEIDAWRDSLGANKMSKKPKKVVKKDKAIKSKKVTTQKPKKESTEEEDEDDEDEDAVWETGRSSDKKVYASKAKSDKAEKKKGKKHKKKNRKKNKTTTTTTTTTEKPEVEEEDKEEAEAEADAESESEEATTVKASGRGMGGRRNKNIAPITAIDSISEIGSIV